MKATDSFKNIIEKHLQDVGGKDPLFAETLKKENKNINDCITYILNQVQKSGCNGFADEEIFGMAIHYYDENEIEVGKPVNAKVVVNHSVELSDDEVEQAKKEAREKVIQEELARVKKKSINVREMQTTGAQVSLF